MKSKKQKKGWDDVKINRVCVCVRGVTSFALLSYCLLTLLILKFLISNYIPTLELSATRVTGDAGLKIIPLVTHAR